MVDFFSYHLTRQNNLKDAPNLTKNKKEKLNHSFNCSKSVARVYEVAEKKTRSGKMNFHAGTLICVGMGLRSVVLKLQATRDP